MPEPCTIDPAGYRPEQVDLILFTHEPPDHLWGLADKATGKLLFPNAEYAGSERELKFWSDPALPSQVPAGMRAMVETTQQHLKLISSRFHPVEAGAEIAPGITSIDTPGHTPWPHLVPCRPRQRCHARLRRRGGERDAESPPARVGLRIRRRCGTGRRVAERR